MSSQPRPTGSPHRRSPHSPPRASPSGAPPGALSNAPDHALLNAWRERGAQLAAKHLYHRHFDAIFRFFRIKAADHSEASDLASETFMRLFHRRASYPEIQTFRDGEPNIRPYLFGIAKHVLMAYIRKRSRRESLDASAETLSALVPLSPISVVFVSRGLNAVLRGLRTLPIHDQILIEAKYFDDFSERELACLLEIPPSTVPGRLRGARTRLREAIHQARAPGSIRGGDPPMDIDELLTRFRNEMRKGAVKPLP